MTIWGIYLLSRPKDPSKSFSEDEGDSTVEVEVQTPYPFNQNLLLSEESEDDDNKEEDADLPVASWHPKPLGVSSETYWSAVSFIRVI